MRVTLHTFRLNADPPLYSRVLMAHDVFISHSTKDQAAAAAVCSALQANGVRCWIAPRDIPAGASWTEAIVDAIAECRMVVLVFSENANASKMVAREVGLADDHGRPIAPIRIADVKPTKTLQFYLSSSHWLNAHTPPLERHLDQLVQSVRTTLGLGPQAIATAPAATERAPAAATPEARPVSPPPVATPSVSARAAPPRPGPDRTFTNSLGMKFFRIEPGEFLMGSPETEEGHEDNETQHKVKITKPYFLAATPVTQAQWAALMGSNPSRFNGDDRPVEAVSWDEATQFCQTVSDKEGKRYRLPTEAEWEYACRAGATGRFYTGDGERALAEAGWYSGNSSCQTQPIARKTPNAWGLYDMLGNVWEWCFDRFGAYPSQPVTDPEGPREGSLRVLRGGSWNYDRGICRAAYRCWRSPGCRDGDVGFRLALDIP